MEIEKKIKELVKNCSKNIFINLSPLVDVSGVYLTIQSLDLKAPLFIFSNDLKMLFGNLPNHYSFKEIFSISSNPINYILRFKIVIIYCSAIQPGLESETLETILNIFKINHPCLRIVFLGIHFKNLNYICNSYGNSLFCDLSLQLDYEIFPCGILGNAFAYEKWLDSRVLEYISNKKNERSSYVIVCATRSGAEELRNRLSSDISITEANIICIHGGIESKEINLLRNGNKNIICTTSYILSLHGINTDYVIFKGSNKYSSDGVKNLEDYEILEYISHLKPVKNIVVYCSKDKKIDYEKTLKYGRSILNNNEFTIQNYIIPNLIHKKSFKKMIEDVKSTLRWNKYIDKKVFEMQLEEIMNDFNLKKIFDDSNLFNLGLFQFINFNYKIFKTIYELEGTPYEILEKLSEVIKTKNFLNSREKSSVKRILPDNIKNLNLSSLTLAALSYINDLELLNANKWDDELNTLKDYIQIGILLNKPKNAQTFLSICILHCSLESKFGFEKNLAYTSINQISEENPFLIVSNQLVTAAIKILGNILRIKFKRTREIKDSRIFTILFFENKIVGFQMGFSSDIFEIKLQNDVIQYDLCILIESKYEYSIYGSINSISAKFELNGYYHSKPLINELKFCENKSRTKKKEVPIRQFSITSNCTHKIK